MKFFKKKLSKITLGLVCCLVGLGTYSVIQDDYRYILAIKDSIIRPLLFVQTSLIDTVMSWRIYVQRQESLEQEIQRLQETSMTHQARVIALEADLLFTQETQELIEHRNRYAIPNAQLARILLKNVDTTEHACYIDCGSNQQVRPDSAVVYKNCLVGRVIQVYPTYSKVMLTTDKNCKVAVVCAHTKTPGIWEGTCDATSGMLRHVSHLQTIEVEDLLLCNGEGLVYPYGFCVGRIASFDRTSVDYTVRVTPALDVTTLRYCYVIPPKTGGLARENVEFKEA